MGSRDEPMKSLAEAVEPAEIARRRIEAEDRRRQWRDRVAAFLLIAGIILAVSLALGILRSAGVHLQTPVVP